MLYARKKGSSYILNLVNGTNKVLHYELKCFTTWAGTGLLLSKPFFSFLESWMDKCQMSPQMVERSLGTQD